MSNANAFILFSWWALATGLEWWALLSVVFAVVYLWIEGSSHK